MGYVEPNSDINICAGVPLDPEYQNLLYFSTRTEQYNYFASKAVKSFNNQSYQRVGAGKMRLDVGADTIQGCNYLMFRNSSYNVKWFYAFITSIDYINNDCCEISYELDVFSTYGLFDVTYRRCFIEREHTPDDNIGKWTQPEPIDIGDLICTSMNTEWIFKSYAAVIAMAES